MPPEQIVANEEVIQEEGVQLNALDLFTIPDEDFRNAGSLEAVSEILTKRLEEPAVTEAAKDEPEVGATNKVDPATEENVPVKPVDVVTTATEANIQANEANKDKSNTNEADKPKVDADKKPEGQDTNTPVVTVEGEAATPDAAAMADFYKQVMAPIKANGRMIELKTPQEAIQLMQMGADYTRKMKILAPHRATIAMLEKANIDQGKLTYLIDLDKKNPEAIKKLIKDSGIDVLDLDPKEEPNYQPGSHGVTDQEVKFNTVFDDLKSSQSGLDTLNVINSSWDQASREHLWIEPEVMEVMDKHRSEGIYDKIASEIDRRKTLGQIKHDTPFLTAYKQVGDELQEAGAFVTEKPKPVVDANTQSVAQPVVVPAVPVAKRTPAPPKPQVSNAEQARAAAATQGTPAAPAKAINFLDMSDEDFKKLAGTHRFN